MVAAGNSGSSFGTIGTNDRTVFNGLFSVRQPEEKGVWTTVFQKECLNFTDFILFHAHKFIDP